MDDDRIRWDDRYRHHDPAQSAPPDAVRGRPLLLDSLPTSGRALDLACGAGAQALWMAHRGLDVIALDISPVAVDLLRCAAAAAALPIDVREHDTDDGLPDDVAELDLIVCQRYRVPLLYTSLVERLRSGGLLVLTVLSEVGAEGRAGPFHAPAGELRDAYASTATVMLLDEESSGVASIVLRAL